MVKNLPASAGGARDGFNPWVGKIPWTRKWQPTPVFLAGKFHRQRSLADYSPWSCKESDTTGHTHTHTRHSVPAVSAPCRQDLALSCWCVLVTCQAPLSMEFSQARILERVAISFSRGSSPGIEPRSPELQADSLPSQPPGKPFSTIKKC